MATEENCDGCAFNNAANLKKLGVNVSNVNFVVALAGNPNTGKSTVFNALTGLKQHTGNWPGKTIARMEGGFSYNDKRYKLVDLPGTYSLLSTSEDEEIARNFILFGNPDVTVVVVDATRLERNLNLVLQILEITKRVVVCLNLLDEAKRHHIKVDERVLARELGVPVVGTSARFNKGIDELIKVVHDVATGQIVCKPHVLKSISGNIRHAVNRLAGEIEKHFEGITNSRWLAIRLLEGDQSLIEALGDNRIADMVDNQNRVMEKIAV